MLPATLIERKRDGETLDPGELRTFLDAYLRGDLADYQMSAFLMAVFFRGLSPGELSALTRAIVESGTRLSFDDGGAPAVDKHSTGGVGDKVSLVLAPLVAAAGLRVPMMSGRGLGHTGGTLDKLESIPGFEVNLGLDRFREVLARVGCAMIGQTPEIAPLDGRLYGLRDVTGTVPSIPLIASSIVSKKVAEGVSALVLDVKYGSGAFMREPEDARLLAHTMVELAATEGLRASALLTAMEWPLGRAVGNALEVRESLACLRGEGPADLREVTLELSAELIVSAGIESSRETALASLAARLDDGSALERFARLVELQGGDPRIVDDPDRLPAARVERVLEAEAEGFVSRMDARTFGRAAVALGAGRRRVEDRVDPAVGFELLARPGDDVSPGDPLVAIHAASVEAAEAAEATLREAISVGPHGPLDVPLVLDRIRPDGG